MVCSVISGGRIGPKSLVKGLYSVPSIPPGDMKASSFVMLDTALKIVL